MKNLGVYLAIENNSIKKVVTASNMAEAKIKLAGFEVIKITNKTHFYVTDETSKELMGGKITVIMSITKSPSINPVVASDTHIMFSSRVFEVNKYQPSIGQFTTTWSGNQRFSAWIKLGVELEGWKVVKIGKIS
jgi:hypothetical protein